MCHRKHGDCVGCVRCVSPETVKTSRSLAKRVERMVEDVEAKTHHCSLQVEQFGRERLPFEFEIWTNLKVKSDFLTF